MIDSSGVQTEVGDPELDDGPEPADAGVVEPNGAKVPAPTEAKVAEPNGTRVVEPNGTRVAEANGTRVVEPNGTNGTRVAAPTGAETESEAGTEVEVASTTEAKVADPTEVRPETAPDEAPDDGSDPTSPDRTGWQIVREGIRETAHGTGMVARAGWTGLRSKLPGAQSSLGLVAWAVAALVVVVAVVAVAADALQKTPAVVVSTARPATINARPGGVGTTTPAQNLSFSVGLNIDGITAPVTVTGVNVINGSVVQKGQALLSLDPAALEQNVASVKALLSTAQLALAAAEASGGSGAVYPIASLQGQVAVDQQLLAIAQGNSNTIDAPIAGAVTNLTVQPGQAVRPGTTMLQIVDTSQIDVTAGLQLSDMQSVRVGQFADVVPTGLVGVHMPGVVVAINPTATGGGLQGSVVIQTNNLPSNPLPIGTQVFVRIAASRHAAVSVPAIAVQNLDLAPAVFVVSHGHVHVTPVTVGAVDANRAQILSGLAAGQVVAESNTQLLTNGERVTTG